MGQYLLKGYKMLGTCFPVCGTILLRNKQGTDYCVTCNELSSDTDKDNPVVSEETTIDDLSTTAAAAAEQAADYTITSVSNTQHDTQRDMMSSTAANNQPLPDISAAANRLLLRLDNPGSAQSDIELGERDVMYDSAPMTIQRLPISNQILDSRLMSETVTAVESRINWANRQLSNSTQIEQITSLCDLIQKCLLTLKMIKGLP